jgi:hypothetical protein
MAPGSPRQWSLLARLCTLCGLASAAWLLAHGGLRSPLAFALGERTAVDIRVLTLASGAEAPRPTAAQRIAWEVRQRTSVETRLPPTGVRFSDASLFESGLVYWAGQDAFEPLSEAERVGLRRFVEFGGFVLIDDAAPERSGFDASVRREMELVFGKGALAPLPESHTVYRSFYLLDRPYGRVASHGKLEAVERGGRAAVIYMRNDLGGAIDRDNLGNFHHPVVPGGDVQRENAVRLAVNLVLYALCLDYKDDQVHSPFIMRRRAGQP